MKTYRSSYFRDTFNLEIIDNNSITILPSEIIIEIFNHLNFIDFARCIVASKQWYVLLTPRLDKQRESLCELVFSPNHWDHHFKNNGMTEEEKAKALRTLPLNIDQIPCPVDPEKRMIDTWSFVYIPKGLTINSYGELLKQKYPNNSLGYYYIWSKIFEKFGNAPIEKSGWRVMKKTPIPHTLGNNFTIQKRIVDNLNKTTSKNFKIPTLLEAIICVSLEFFKSGNKIFGQHFTRCKEKACNFQLMVGDSPNGLIINKNHGRRDQVGMTAFYSL